MIESDSIKPVIDSTVGFAETPQALAHHGDGHAAGKVVITVESTPDQEG